MNNCIFTAHCTELTCDRSCPAYVETSYLLERNEINFNNLALYADKSMIDQAVKVLDKSVGNIGAHVVSGRYTTIQWADTITYAAICQNWQGSQLHTTVYNLRLSKYLDMTKRSWGMKGEPDDLEYMNIWARSAKILIISNFDYVNFGDFESQTLLNLLQERQNGELTTILVTPPLKSLVSSKASIFFNSLKTRLNDAVKVVSK